MTSVAFPLYHTVYAYMLEMGRGILFSLDSSGWGTYMAFWETSLQQGNYEWPHYINKIVRTFMSVLFSPVKELLIITLIDRNCTYYCLDTTLVNCELIRRPPTLWS